MNLNKVEIRGNLTTVKDARFKRGEGQRRGRSEGGDQKVHQFDTWKTSGNIDGRLFEEVVRRGVKKTKGCGKN